jgi:hypothetical protein
MASEDYLIRYFRQLGNVLASIFDYRKRKEFSLAIDEIDQTLISWFNVNAEGKDIDQSFISRMIKNHSQNFETESVLAELLYQKAITLRDMGNSVEASSIALLSLQLYKEIDREGGQYSVEIQLHISELECLKAKNKN